MRQGPRTGDDHGDQARSPRQDEFAGGLSRESAGDLRRRPGSVHDPPGWRHGEWGRGHLVAILLRVDPVRLARAEVQRFKVQTFKWVRESKIRNPKSKILRGGWSKASRSSLARACFPGRGI